MIFRIIYLPHDDGDDNHHLKIGLPSDNHHRHHDHHHHYDHQHQSSSTSSHLLTGKFLFSASRLRSTWEHHVRLKQQGNLSCTYKQCTMYIECTYMYIGFIIVPEKCQLWHVHYMRTLYASQAAGQLFMYKPDCTCMLYSWWWWWLWPEDGDDNDDLMMTTGNGQITSSLTIMVLDEEVGTMAH